MATDYYKMGLGLGEAYSDGKEAKKQREIRDEERAYLKTQRDNAAADRTYAIDERTKVDDAVGAYGLATTKGTRNQAVADANAMDFDAPAAAVQQGLVKPTPTHRPEEWTPATERELLNARRGIAVAKKDVQGMAGAELEGKALDWKDAYAAADKKFDAMGEDELSKTIQAASENAAIPGSGTWVKGDGKVKGYMWYTAPGKDPVKLSAAEAKQFFTLSQLSALDPIRARAEMDKAGDKLRGIYNTIFDQNLKGVTANNTATHYSNQDDLRAQGLRQSAQQHRDNQRAAPRELKPETIKRLNELGGQIDAATDPKVKAGLQATYDREYRMAGTELGKVIPPGRAQVPREVLPADVLNLAKEYAGQPDPDSPKKPMTMQRARQVAYAELSTGQYVSAADKIFAGVPQEDPRVKPIAPAQGLAIPRSGPPSHIPGYGAPSMQEQQRAEADRFAAQREAKLLQQQRQEAEQAQAQMRRTPVGTYPGQY